MPLSAPGGIDAHPEIVVEYEKRVVNDTGTVDVSLVDYRGDPVENAHVILVGETLVVDEPGQAHTGQHSNTVSFSIDPGPDTGGVTPDWRTTQERGNLSVEIVPSAEGTYVDYRTNTEVTVMRTTDGA